MGQSTDRTAPRPFLFALRHFLTPELLRHALSFSGQRTRTRVLPAPFVLLVLVAGFLQGRLGLPRILAWLGFGGDLAVSDQALYQARQRLGWRPVWWLRRHALGWLARAGRDPTAFDRRRRLLAVDGTTLTVADTPDNTRTFGKSRNQHALSGFPRVRLVVLCELGTRALVRGIARPYRVSEPKLLPRLLPHVPPGVAPRGRPQLPRLGGLGVRPAGQVRRPPARPSGAEVPGPGAVPGRHLPEPRAPAPGPGQGPAGDPRPGSRVPDHDRHPDRHVPAADEPARPGRGSRPGGRGRVRPAVGNRGGR